MYNTYLPTFLRPLPLRAFKNFFFIDVNGHPLPRNNNHAYETMQSKLGILDHVIIFGGVAALLATASFLAFLWFGDPNNRVWNAIMFDGWLIRTVTILALVIRTIVASQLLICVSMLAGLVLERGQSPLPGSAAISMMRFQNSGPLGLFYRLWPAVRSSSGFALGATTVIIGLVAIALQFTSTALLSDVSPAFVSTGTVESLIKYALNNNGSRAGTMGFRRSEQSKNYLYSEPIFPLFAEYAEPPPTTAADGVTDTGLSIRAFLPVASSADRGLLREYNGPSTLFDTRVVCMRPDPASTHLRFRYIHDPAGVGDTFPLLTGHVSSSLSARRFTGAAKIDFNCSYSSPPSFEELEEWPVTLCAANALSRGETRLVSDMRPFPLNSTQKFGSRVPTEAFLVINATGSANDWTSYQHDAPGGETEEWMDLEHAQSENEWLHLKADAFDIGFSVSLCFYSGDYTNDIIHASTTAKTAIDEPSVSWRVADAAYNTGYARRQLAGLEPIKDAQLVPEDRGIFRLSPLDTWLSYDEYGLALLKSVNTSVNLETNINPTSSTCFTIALCSACDCAVCSLQRANITYLHAAQAAVVNQMLMTTRSAAKGTQALISMHIAQTYYDQLDFFDIAGSTKMSSMALISKPVGTRFFTMIVGLIAFHSIVVLTIVAVFVRTTKHTIIGNAWQIAAQFQGSEIKPWCQDSFISDAEIQKRMEMHGVGGVLVKLEETEGVVLIKRHEKIS